MRLAIEKEGCRRATLLALMLMLMLIGTVRPAASQGLSLAVDSDAIMGFETPVGWMVTGNTATAPTESSTNIHTQGTFALAIKTPSNLTKLTSMPVASTARALAGVGNFGASFEVDVMLPTQQGNTNNPGQLQLLVNSRSRGLINVLVGTVPFHLFRLGNYNTMNFPIPAAIGSVLGAASFSDLTFQFLVGSPGTGQGTYLFDHLRVHSVALVLPATTGTLPPPGYGGAVDFVVFGGGVPVAQSFDIAPVQVPDSFHLKLGTAWGTTVELDLGYVAGTPAITCMYSPDSTDATGKSYIVMSCTGGNQPGDIVPAAWAQLKILGGDPSTQKLRAQLAKNPVGDQTGAKILEAMPTWWGDFDACVPAPPVPPAGSPPVVPPPSTSCANQMAEASQIVTAYFNKVQNSTNAANWIVPPTPEFALRHGDGTPFDTATGPPPPGDPAYSKSGSLNHGGSFDAGYNVSANLAPNLDTSANPLHATVHGEATVSTDLVLFGQNVEAAKLYWTIDTDTGPIMLTSIPSPTATGSLHCYLLGSELPNNGPQKITLGGFSFSCHDSTESDFGQINYWIFSIKFGPVVGYGLTTSGTASPSGLSLTVAPDISLGVHIFGGVDVGIASGGVDAKVVLLDVTPSVTAVASWSVTTDPTVCSATLSDSLEADAKLSSAGGEVDLVASFCFFHCWDVSHKIFGWAPLGSHNVSLFDDTPSPQVMDFPALACTAPLNVVINNPPPGTTKRAGFMVPMSGSASDSFVTLNGFDVSNPGNAVPCQDLTWTLVPAVNTDTASPMTGQGCSFTPIFNQPTTPGATSSQWTINLSAMDTYTGAKNGPIPEIGLAAAVPITINALSQGVYIDNLVVPCSGGQNCGTFYSFGDSPTATVTNWLPGISPPVQLNGSMVATSAPPPPSCTMWTATQTSGQTQTTTLIGITSDSVLGSAVPWTPANFPATYMVTMTTDTGACGVSPPTGTFGMTSVTVVFRNVI